MHLTLLTLVPHEWDERRVNDHLDRLLGRYLEDDEAMYEDVDATAEAVSEYEAFCDRVAPRDPAAYCYPDWQSYARDALGWEVRRGSDGEDRAWRRANPQAFLDWWCDYDGSSGPTFPGTRVGRVPLGNLALAIERDAYRLVGVQSFVGDGGWRVTDDATGVEEAVVDASCMSRFAGHDAILVSYHT